VITARAFRVSVSFSSFCSLIPISLC
jgi:hypothetical protein